MRRAIKTTAGGIPIEISIMDCEKPSKTRPKFKACKTNSLIFFRESKYPTKYERGTTISKETIGNSSIFFESKIPKIANKINTGNK